MAIYESYDAYIMAKQMENEVSFRPVKSKSKKAKKNKAMPLEAWQQSQKDKERNELVAARSVISLTEFVFLTDFNQFKNGDDIEDKANIALYRALQEFEDKFKGE